MTEVSKMTDAELNRALAELMGYKMFTSRSTPPYHKLISPAGALVGKSSSSEMIVWRDNAPDYCTDPAASLEVQAAAIAKDEEGYIKHLADIVGANCFWDGMYGDMAPTGIAWLLTATPRQRAEAAFLTLRGEGT